MRMLASSRGFTLLLLLMSTLLLTRLPVLARMVVIEAGARVAAGVRIDAGCTVGRDSQIGVDSRLCANVTVTHGIVIGERFYINSGAVIGSDGFGHANEKGQWHKIARLVVWLLKMM